MSVKSVIRESAKKSEALVGKPVGIYAVLEYERESKYQGLRLLLGWGIAEDYEKADAVWGTANSPSTVRGKTLVRIHDVPDEEWLKRYCRVLTEGPVAWFWPSDLAVMSRQQFDVMVIAQALASGIRVRECCDFA